MGGALNESADCEEDAPLALTEIHLLARMIMCYDSRGKGHQICKRPLVDDSNCQGEAGGANNYKC